MDLLDLAVRRIGGGIDLYNEILKEAATTKKSCDGQLSRESGHRFKEVSEDHHLHFVKIHRNAQTADHTVEFVSNSVLKALDAQRMANTRMKDANVSPRVNPALNRLCGRRMMPS